MQVVKDLKEQRRRVKEVGGVRGGGRQGLPEVEERRMALNPGPWPLGQSS